MSSGAERASKTLLSGGSFILTAAPRQWIFLSSLRPSEESLHSVAALFLLLNTANCLRSPVCCKQPRGVSAGAAAPPPGAAHYGARLRDPGGGRAGMGRGTGGTGRGAGGRAARAALRWETARPGAFGARWVCSCVGFFEKRFRCLTGERWEMTQPRLSNPGKNNNNKKNQQPNNLTLFLTEHSPFCCLSARGMLVWLCSDIPPTPHPWECVPMGRPAPSRAGGGGSGLWTPGASTSRGSAVPRGISGCVGTPLLPNHQPTPEAFPARQRSACTHR